MIRIHSIRRHRRMDGFYALEKIVVGFADMSVMIVWQINILQLRVQL